MMVLIRIALIGCYLRTAMDVELLDQLALVFLSVGDKEVSDSIAFLCLLCLQLQYNVTIGYQAIRLPVLGTLLSLSSRTIITKYHKETGFLL